MRRRSPSSDALPVCLDAHHLSAPHVLPFLRTKSSWPAAGEHSELHSRVRVAAWGALIADKKALPPVAFAGYFGVFPGCGLLRRRWVYGAAACPRSRSDPVRPCHEPARCAAGRHRRTHFLCVLTLSICPPPPNVPLSPSSVQLARRSAPICKRRSVSMSACGCLSARWSAARAP